MAQFTSRAQIAFNTDPEPFVRLSDGARGDFSLGAQRPQGAGQAETLILDPRPEYTPMPHNPTNAALAQFRQMHGTRSGADLVHAAIAWRGNLGTAALCGVYSIEEATHASRVLTRIIDAALIPA